MSVPIVHESEIEALGLPGRLLRWIANEDIMGARHLSVCVIQVAPGEKVRPAHSHPNGEELIYLIHGTGRVMVDGCVEAVCKGAAVLFPQGSVHMLQNTGDGEMKVICFFAPPSDLSTYKFFPEVDFPD